MSWYAWRLEEIDRMLDENKTREAIMERFHLSEKTLRQIIQYGLGYAQYRRKRRSSA